jgi:hypothetical protein
MCVIVVNKSMLKKKLFKKAFAENGDGFGMAYTENGELYIAKVTTGLKEAYKTYCYLRSKHRGPMLLHFRLATHGSKDVSNCHPFQVNENMCFAHNGIFQLESTNKAKSDTAAFADILRAIPNFDITNEACRLLVEMAVGSYNKLAFLTSKGEYYIVNEEGGKWKKGDWFSNLDFERMGFYNRYVKGSRIEDEIAEQYGEADLYRGKCDTYRGHGTRSDATGLYNEEGQNIYVDRQGNLRNVLTGKIEH